MKRFLFWQRWLFAFSLLVIVFGLGMALLNRTFLFSVLDAQVNPAFWNTDVSPSGVNEFQGWIYGVLGATMAGWGVFLAFIAYYPFPQREQWAWNAMTLGLALWYITDTSISLYFGVVFNAVLNTLLFIAGMLPLLFSQQEFHRSWPRTGS